MLPLLLVVAVAALGLYLLARAFLFANPRALAQGVRYGGYGLGAAVFLFMAMRGELGPLLALSAFVVPLLARARRRAAAARPRGGQASQVETLYLRMSLDHDSGAIGGEVLHGPFKGRTLDQLAPAEASTLLDDCRRDDPPSAAVLEAWLDRTHPDWRERFAEAGPQPAQRGDGPMTREEAYEILGLSPGASAEQVRQAHRRLMMGVHPDHGGSTYLAAKINQAKDLLLRP